ncbi:MAG: hypothetical protein KDN19_15580 [Verrucomicrobiae bacterium]|nr:hypothetical protein [Verrucomicrobiae bacterium]
MKTTPLLLALLASLVVLATASDIEKDGTLLFEDHFERDEPTPDQEAIGDGWSSNSAWRAKGRKQVDLKDGAMHVTRVPEADHGVAIFHTLESVFADGAVELRFQLADGDDLGIDFVDRELKTVHAGHLCMGRVTLKGLTITDSKTGAMNLEIREKRLAGLSDPELQKLMKTKSKTFPLELAANDWHTLRLVIEGDTMTATIDGKEIGAFASEGIAHPTKRWITLAVNKSAVVDDVKIWKLK